MATCPPPELDAARARVVATEVLGLAPGPVRLLGEGCWSRAFAVGPGGRLVLRLGTLLEDFTKDRQAADLLGAAVPVPRVHALGRHGSCTYALTDRVDGTPLEALDEGGWRAVLPDLWRVVDAIAAVPRPVAGGYGEWGPGGHGTRPDGRTWLLGAASEEREARLGRWRHRLADRPGTARLVEAAAGRLATLAPVAEGRRAVVHGDLVNRNVLAVGDRVTGVFDWGCVVDGDPALSVAELEVWGPWYPDGLGRVDVRASRRAHLRHPGDGTDLDARVDVAALYLLTAALCFSLATAPEGPDLPRIEARLATYVDRT